MFEKYSRVYDTYYGQLGTIVEKSDSGIVINYDDGSCDAYSMINGVPVTDDPDLIIIPINMSIILLEQNGKVLIKALEELKDKIL